jgi:uncharacterized membrane protein YccC
VTFDPPGLRTTGFLAAALGAAALFGASLRALQATLVAAAIAVAAGLAVDLPPGPRAAGIAALGAALGIALAALLVWGLVDEARRHLGPVAGRRRRLLDRCRRHHGRRTPGRVTEPLPHAS